MKTLRVNQVADRLGKHPATVWRWIQRGCDIDSEDSIQQFLSGNKRRRNSNLAVETERRTALEQIPMRQVEDVSAQISTWLRVAFERFLSAETGPLMAIADLGEFKAHAIDRFKGILHLEVKTSLRTNPPIPDWAAAKVVEAWNIH
jgi:hypothetical protein